ncbi:Stk1 family PASTA domain-containing Ser/Thr kinase [Nonomuraea africana]|uniref:non-specific serine/threonine protein kinase n=1 Tax=Nonomuraea africana TaxID=46171 RepID=A0ABR9KIR4_9ACTN|nr:Stk1 family PASTA domain-containing Ser/Thr kinase [Nonomuraea africana]MBE1561523.1 serine/threonine-protein kinase [Nonomuraea africana]
MDTTIADPLVGRLLDGRYRIESRIARGGMATVYLALDIRLDRTVALKVMHRSLAEDPAFVRRFIGEAKSVASLSHPNVVHVFDQGTDGDVVYLSMEYVPGKTLRDVLRARGRLPAREALEIMIPVLAALGAAHQQGMVHRDMKPENVLLTDDGRVKVVDFGLARAIEATNQTRTGVMIGTIGYMSPEQVMTGGADVRSDVYAAGIMLFELVTGRQPYDGETPMSVAYRHVHDTVPPPSSLVEAPPLIDTLVAQATAREPDDRPADATAMLVAAVDAHRMLPRESSPPYSTGQHFAPSGEHQRARVAPANPTLVAPRTEVLTAPAGQSEPPRRGGFRPNWFLVTLAALMVVAVGLTGWYFAQNQYVFVPELVGKNVTIAKNEAVKNGFVVKVAEGQYDEKVGEGKVLSTDPVGRTEVEAGATITIVPSLGAKRVTVPNVEGLDQNDAAVKLSEAGLELGKVTKVANPKVQRGLVTQTRPSIGDKVKEGTSVNLVLSAGLVMPDVSGMSKDEAAQFLTEQGFQVQVNEVDDDAEPCTVIAQNPRAKAEVDPGTMTSVTVSRCGGGWSDWFGRNNGNHEAEDQAEFRIVPNVVFKSVQDATTELQQQGYKVRVRNISNGAQVRFQSPRGGEERPPNTMVTIWR